MPYEILGHIADLRIAVEGETLPELFSEALRALTSVLKSKIKEERRAEAERAINIKSGDRTSLLVDFLGEALALCQINKEVYTKVVFKNFSDTSLEAALSGIKADGFDRDIKAVAYHEADIKKNKRGNWETKLVFDV